MFKFAPVIERYPYLDNTKSDVRNLGLASLMNSFAANFSSQRGMMLASHLQQAQVVRGSEHPRIMSGFESMIGEYEHSTTDRDQDIQIMETIPKFITNTGMSPIKSNPLYTVIYRGNNDNKIDYLQLERYTLCSNGYGYQNKWLNTNQLNKGNFISKDLKLSTSPAHDGHKYGMGTNLNTCYMSIPPVTEDAFVISKSAAKKLSSDGIGKIAFKIAAHQIPLNLYGDDDNYKFIPDVGEKVNEDGLLCSIRSPNENSVLTDLSIKGLKTPQPLHDMQFHVPPGAEIIDIDVIVNKKCKHKTPKEIFSQVQKYRDNINDYHLQIWKTYKQAVDDGLEITPAFNSLVTRAVGSLLADNVRVPGYAKKADVSLVKKKEAIEFMYVTVSYRYTNEVNLGFKITGLFGNKGVVSAIWDDEDMPVDAQGIRADIIIDPVSVFNRMNPGQWYQQFLNRGATLLLNRIRANLQADSSTNNWLNAYASIHEYLKDCNPKWATIVEATHQSNELKMKLVQESLDEDKIFIQISPFQKGIDHHFILKMNDKYNIGKSEVDYTITHDDGTRERIHSESKIMIGSEYFVTLYKMPHLHCANLAYVNQYGSPTKANQMSKYANPTSMTPIRYGEDEIRNLAMVAGHVTAARMLGTYANSPPAVRMLAEHLLFAENPAQLEQIDLSTEDIVNTNNIMNVTHHIFSCFGVDVTARTEGDGYGNVVNL